MGHIDISDGIGTRRIPVGGLERSIRIEIDGEHSHVIIPEGIHVEHQQP